MAARAGWYRDPWKADALRWWDGATWSGYTAERGSPRPTAVLPASPEVAPDPSFDPRALPYGVGGILTTVVLARVASTLLHDVALPIPALLAVFYLVVFGGLWSTCLAVSHQFGTGNPWSDFGWAWKGTDALRGILGFVVARILAVIAVSPWINRLGRIQRLTEGYKHVSLPTFVIFGVSAVFAAPLLEELVFRGMLLRTITARAGGRAAVLLQGAAFGMYHFIPQLGWDNVPYVIELACFGVVAGWLARRTRRLGPGCAAHFANNTVATIVVAASR